MRFMMVFKASDESEAGADAEREEPDRDGSGDGRDGREGRPARGRRLLPSSNGFRLQLDGGKRRVVDGPFAETKELIAGFCLIEVASREEALEWGWRCLAADDGNRTGGLLEIRQVATAGRLRRRVHPRGARPRGADLPEGRREPSEEQHLTDRRAGGEVVEGPLRSSSPTVAVSSRSTGSRPAWYSAMYRGMSRDGHRRAEVRALHRALLGDQADRGDAERLRRMRQPDRDRGPAAARGGVRLLEHLRAADGLEGVVRSARRRRPHLLDRVGIPGVDRRRWRRVTGPARASPVRRRPRRSDAHRPGPHRAAPTARRHRGRRRPHSGRPGPAPCSRPRRRRSSPRTRTAPRSRAGATGRSSPPTRADTTA